MSTKRSGSASIAEPAIASVLSAHATRSNWEEARERGRWLAAGLDEWAGGGWRVAPSCDLVKESQGGRRLHLQRGSVRACALGATISQHLQPCTTTAMAEQLIGNRDAEPRYAVEVKSQQHVKHTERDTKPATCGAWLYPHTQTSVPAFVAAPPPPAETAGVISRRRGRLGGRPVGGMRHISADTPPCTI